MYQVNGGLGHTDQNYNLRRTFQSTDFPSMYRGISTKMINLLAYTFLYSWWLADNNKEWGQMIVYTVSSAKANYL